MSAEEIQLLFSRMAPPPPDVKVGEHHLVIGGEVDCAEALRGGKLGHYMELKTTRLMDTAPQ
eukprot:gene26833-32983_t